jgi:hypothetical protein
VNHHYPWLARLSYATLRLLRPSFTPGCIRNPYLILYIYLFIIYLLFYIVQCDVF